MLVVSHSRLLFSCSNTTFFSFSRAEESDAKQTANSVRLIVAFVLAALTAFGLSLTPVQAQTVNSQSSASQRNESAGQTLEEVVVTAQKRQERLQDAHIRAVRCKDVWEAKKIPLLASTLSYKS